MGRPGSRLITALVVVWSLTAVAAAPATFTVQLERRRKQTPPPPSPDASQLGVLPVRSSRAESPQSDRALTIEHAAHNPRQPQNHRQPQQRQHSLPAPETLSHRHRMPAANLDARPKQTANLADWATTPQLPANQMDDSSPRPAQQLDEQLQQATNNYSGDADDQPMTVYYYDTPTSRRLLAKYILGEFHEIDLNSVLDNSSELLEANQKEVFGQVVAEALVDLAPGQLAAMNASRPEHLPFYGEVFESFQTVYYPIHCVISLVICTLGIFANLINVIVLTRPNMISAVNTILCAIACSDLIVNISNIPYLMHELGDSSNESTYYSYNWACYILMHAHITVTSHTLSIWLTCALATWRYCVIRSQSSSKRNWSVSLAVRVILCLVFLVPVFCIPNYLSFAIVRETNERNATIYKVGFSALAEQSQFIKTFHFWIFSCLTKLLPCLLLTYFTTILIKLLAKARERRMRLTNNLVRSSNGNAMSDAKGALPNGIKSSQGRKVSDEGARRRTSDELDKRLAKSNNGRAGFESRMGLLKQPARSSKTDGQRNNLEILARNMSMQMNATVSNEVTACSKSADDMSGTTPLAHSGDELESGTRITGAEGGNHLLEPQRFYSGEHNKTKSTTLGQSAANTGSELSNDKSNNLVCHITPRSGSSCATDAECIQVSANGSLDSSDSSGKVDHKSPKRSMLAQRQQLLVETSAPSSVQQTSSTTKTRALVLTGGERANLLDEDKEQPDKGSVMCGTPRSASTGGALELYAFNNDSGGHQSRVSLTGAQHQQINDDRFTSLHTVNQGLLPNAAVGGGHRTTSAALIGSLPGENHVSVKPAQSKAVSSVLDQESRPRSIGSASFAPLQIVRFQATHRQLSQNETTTRLLIAVIIVFLICEFPAGILAALCAILGQDFFDHVYQPMGTLTDLLALVNSSVNFILYCFMSTQFRVTFYRVVLHCPAPRDVNSYK